MRFGGMPLSERRAEVARRRWARVGGLKEESRTYRVRGGGGRGLESGTDVSMCKVEGEEAKAERAAEYFLIWGRISSGGEGVGTGCFFAASMRDWTTEDQGCLAGKTDDWILCAGFSASLLVYG